MNSHVGYQSNVRTLQFQSVNRVWNTTQQNWVKAITRSVNKAVTQPKESKYPASNTTIRVMLRLGLLRPSIIWNRRAGAPVSITSLVVVSYEFKWIVIFAIRKSYLAITTYKSYDRLTNYIHANLGQPAIELQLIGMQCSHKLLWINCTCHYSQDTHLSKTVPHIY